ncbi:MAG: LysR family transcriptional regulator [Psychromonas sp.]|nr:LysR family transcriptional regulator [Alteromonadales bacterium]MCP5077979.1 LysR family transcriptional regulator [Psychromonas sp.]
MNSVKLAPLLLIFAEVAKKRSFTAAAKQLGSSKSAISQQIKRLEEEVGQQLLARNTRGVTLTAVGEKLLVRSELLSDQLQLTFQELDSTKAQPSGSFKVAIPPFFENGIVIPALAQLCREYPQIKPEIVVSGKWHDPIQHNLDASIFGGDLQDSDYRALSIGKVAEQFFASPAYIKQYGELANIKALSKHQYIATPWQQGYLQLMDENSVSTQLTVTHYAKANSVTTVLEMLRHDMGIALFPEFLAQSELANGHLIKLLPETKGRAWHFYFLHRYQAEKPVHVSRFYQLVCYYFTKMNSH